MPVLDPHPVYFPKAVSAILDQTFRDFELIISEAPGGTPAAGQLRQFDDPRIIHDVLPGGSVLIDQRNHGLLKARADLVSLADADDICDPDRLTRQVAFLDAHPETDVLSCQLQIIDERDKALGFRIYPTGHDELVRCMPAFNPIAQPGVTFRKAVILASGGYQYRKYAVNSDYELWSRLAREGARFAVLPEVLVRYRLHRGSIKTSRIKDVLRATIDIKKTYWMSEMGLTGRLRMAAEYGLQFLPGTVILALFRKLQISGRRR